MFRLVILKDSSNILHLRNQHHIDDKHSDSKHTLDEIQQKIELSVNDLHRPTTQVGRRTKILTDTARATMTDP